MSPVFGPETFARTSGPPNVDARSFSNCEPSAAFKLAILNGKPDGSNRVRAASVTLNGVVVAGPEDFNQNRPTIEKAVTLQPDNTLEVSLRGAPGDELSASIVCIANCLRASITEPSPGATIEGPLVVAGNVGSSSDHVAVSVAQRPADLASNRFAIAGVTLPPGPGTVSAIVTNSCGQTARASIPIVVAPNPKGVVTLRASPGSRGIPPFSTTLRLFATLSSPIARVDWDQDGDRVVDVSGAAEMLVVNYDSAGLYIPSVNVTDASGNHFSARTVVAVVAPDKLTASLQVQWDDFVSALAGGDRSRAIQLVHATRQDIYRRTLEDPSLSLSDLANSLTGALALREVRGGRAFFTLGPVDGRRSTALQVSFRLGDDGSWHLWSL